MGLIVWGVRERERSTTKQYYQQQLLSDIYLHILYKNNIAICVNKICIERTDKKQLVNYSTYRIEHSLHYCTQCSQCMKFY